MNITRTLSMLLLFLLSSFVFGQSDDLEANLRRALEQNFLFGEQEQIESTMKFIHRASPIYDSTRETMLSIFDVYDLEYDLLSFYYISTDGVYALARGKQQTSKLTGPAFNNNIIDSIYIFRQEQGTWKLWQQSILDIEFF